MKRRDQRGSRKNKVTILLLGALLASCISLNLKVEARASSQSPPLQTEIDAKLKLLNKPGVKTIHSEDGDIIDCVDIYKQPAFDHPALKNHIIQEIPNFLLESNNKNASNSEYEVAQIWQRSGSCPKGTIPIRRIQKEDLLRTSSLERFGMKPPEPFKNSAKITSGHFLNLNATINDLKDNVPDNRSVALLATMGFNYIGAAADINTWNPFPNVELADDFTTAQIWLKTASGSDLFESVEAGWMVNPVLFGDKSTRLFACWTRDAYISTGCFNLKCPGFVQTSSGIALGGALSPLSSIRGPQYDFNYGLSLDPNTQNWWFKLNGNAVGYFPAEILSGLRHSATLVQWGGQVYSTGVQQTPHTGTGMGSGEFASGKQGQACYMKNIRIQDYSLQLKYPQFVDVLAQEPYCYSALNYREGFIEEPTFFFGGPGRVPPYCP